MVDQPRLHGCALWATIIGVPLTLVAIGIAVMALYVSSDFRKWRSGDVQPVVTSPLPPSRSPINQGAPSTAETVVREPKPTVQSPATPKPTPIATASPEPKVVPPTPAPAIVGTRAAPPVKVRNMMTAYPADAGFTAEIVALNSSIGGAARLVLEITSNTTRSAFLPTEGKGHLVGWSLVDEGTGVSCYTRTDQMNTLLHGHPLAQIENAAPDMRDVSAGGGVTVTTDFICPGAVAVGSNARLKAQLMFRGDSGRGVMVSFSGSETIRGRN